MFGHENFDRLLKKIELNKRKFSGGFFTFLYLRSIDAADVIFRIFGFFGLWDFLPGIYWPPPGLLGFFLCLEFGIYWPPPGLLGFFSLLGIWDSLVAARITRISSYLGFWVHWPPPGLLGFFLLGISGPTGRLPGLLGFFLAWDFGIYWSPAKLLGFFWIFSGFFSGFCFGLEVTNDNLKESLAHLSATHR